jgi:hypothetical protein
MRLMEFVTWSTFPSPEHKLCVLQIAAFEWSMYPPEWWRVARHANTTPNRARECIEDLIDYGLLYLEDGHVCFQEDVLRLLAADLVAFEGGVLDLVVAPEIACEYLNAPDEDATSVEPDESPPQYKKVRIPPELRQQILERDDFTCQRCGCMTNLRVDHIFPECLGGTLDPENLQVLCVGCNSIKGCSVPDGAICK